MATAKEIHVMFDKAEAAGEWFEYECLWQAVDCVRNTEMGYCEIIEAEDARLFVEYGGEKFYEVIREDDTEFSDHYSYYYDELNDAYYAVRKAEHRGGTQKR